MGYKCKSCAWTFSSFKEWREHVKMHHLKKKLHKKRALFGFHGRKKEKKIPNMGVLSPDDILHLRRENVFTGASETGNVFSREDVQEARQQRNERPKYVDFMNTKWF